MLTTLAVAEQTRNWLLKHPKQQFTPELFFNLAWIKSKIVSIGERHEDGAQRRFIAERVKYWGAHQNGLALEIPANYQPAIDAFLGGGASLPADLAFARAPGYRSILEAARAKGMPVLCMDHPAQGRSTKVGEPRITLKIIERDQHMAEQVIAFSKGKNTVLLFSGMAHAAEGVAKGTPSMGQRLAKQFGQRIYTICTMTSEGYGQEPLYKALQAGFGKKWPAIAFDLDRSPLAKAIIIDTAIKETLPWRRYADGLMLFF